MLTRPVEDVRRNATTRRGLWLCPRRGNDRCVSSCRACSRRRVRRQGAVDIPDACNPLGGSACITPWPSSVYEMDDSTTETKRQLDIPVGALPTNFDNIELSPDIYNESRRVLVRRADDDRVLDRHRRREPRAQSKDMARALTDASPTVLIDMSTGELVAHFAELDARGRGQAGEPGALHPARRRCSSRRHALRGRDQEDAQGQGRRRAADLRGLPGDPRRRDDVAPAAREGPRAATPTSSPRSRPRASTRPTSSSRGTSRRARARSVQADLLEARERRARDDRRPTARTSTSRSTRTTVPSDTRIARRIDGTFDAPLFLDQRRRLRARHAARARRAPASRRRTGSTARRSPRSSRSARSTAATPVPIILYGHGLLGDVEPGRERWHARGGGRDLRGRDRHRHARHERRATSRTSRSRSTTATTVT